eukprot:2520701-Alexandrium_andersonii.AAC.1
MTGPTARCGPGASTSCAPWSRPNPCLETRAGCPSACVPRCAPEAGSLLVGCQLRRRVCRLASSPSSASC